MSVRTWLTASAVALMAACATTPPPLVVTEPIAEPLVTVAGYKDLSTTVRLDFPPDVTRVGEAVEFLLEATDYQLLVYCTGCPLDAPGVATDPISPLAFVHPLALTSAERAILLVLGQDSRIVVDNDLRSISFERLREGDTQRVVQPISGFTAAAAPPPPIVGRPAQGFNTAAVASGAGQ